MSIKDVEEKTGLSRSNIRFYEKEKLIQPARNDSNGYRDYSEQNVEDIKKIAYLRTLGISIENIKRIMRHEVSLHHVLAKQVDALAAQSEDLDRTKATCLAMLAANDVTYDTLDIEAYTPELPAYWQANQKVFKLDSVGAVDLWGGLAIWGLITAASLLIALLTYSGLPAEIPIQWSQGAVSSSVSKLFIFAYPAACVLLRLVLNPIIGNRLQNSMPLFRDMLSNYITNFLCFVAVSVEVFTVLYVYGIVRHVTTLLIVDAVVFIGLLLGSTVKLSRAPELK